ncbi:Mur ligase family protein [Bulleidia extructa]|uniref:Mur ligase family protein n=1 Tax=Bulleidia extructa TaxID=118748 RepID=UPI0023541D1B|nr:Mur ligase family protein [Bulleidia extructa]
MSLSLRLVQVVGKVLQKMGRGGSFPGTLGLKLDPQMISKFRMPKIVILVTGTNGKTTTANLLAESLRQSGLKVVHNRKGDNLNVGIASLLAMNSDGHYRIQADACVIEVDELTLYHQFKALHPSHLVVHNFFRDQLDRAGEMETIIRRVEEIIRDFKGTLILNGDDPNVVRLADQAKQARVQFYSVCENAVSQNTTDEASEGKFCPRCGNRLVYDYYQYSHIGRFYCERDDFGKIQPTVYVHSIQYDRHTFQALGKSFHSFMNTIYAIYNCAAVLTVMRDLGLDVARANQVFKTFQMKEGRNEVFELSKPCIINLIKNPTGTNEVLKYILKDEQEKNVVIILNDNDQDGCDVSWIWDAHFERLLKGNVRHILTSGKRAYDMALRLKYEGLEEKVMVKEKIEEALEFLEKDECPSYVLSTYTALHSTRHLLRKKVVR